MDGVEFQLLIDPAKKAVRRGTDLMAALEASLAKARGNGNGHTAVRTRTRRRRSA